MLELLEKKALAAPSDLIELNGTASDLPEIPVRHGRASDQDPQSVVLVGANRADEGLPAHERLRRWAGLAVRQDWRELKELVKHHIVGDFRVIDAGKPITIEEMPNPLFPDIVSDASQCQGNILVAIRNAQTAAIDISTELPFMREEVRQTGVAVGNDGIYDVRLVGFQVCK
ncbi:hypothetical protein EV128_121118 [Rhizobium azibense]|nr:hypothetical protein EV128_121118 [Rhizobium azibense]